MKNNIAILRTLMVIGAIGLATVTTPAGGATDEGAETSAAADADAVRTAHEDMMRAYADGNAKALVKLLTSSKDLLIYHPRGQLKFDAAPTVEWGMGMMQGRAGKIRHYREAELEIVVRDDVAWATCQLTVAFDRLDDPVEVRATEIWARESGEWRMVHAHWSENPRLD